MHATLDCRTEVDVAGWVEYLTAHGLGPNGPAPIRPLHRGPAHDVLRIGTVVVKAARPGHASLEAMSRIAQTMGRAAGFAPAVLLHDDQRGVLITEFEAAPNWQQLLDAGRIDHRTFGAAGSALRRIHDIGLAHGRFRPDNVLVGQRQALRAVGWSGARAAHHTLPDEAAAFVAHLVAGSVRQPYAHDWYVEAGRWFLTAAGVINRPDLGGQVGRAVADLLPSQAQQDQPELRARAHGLIDGRDRLPW
ncbi:MAG: hypothetical protein QOJ37_3071 [Pseudonocardiales bacterium]|nr:hypothetical protein [Pseudonocardiales bacterium]